MSKKTLDQISEELDSNFHDLKAEVILAELEQWSDLTFDDVLVQNKSTFSRPYRRDVLNTDSFTYDDFLILNLTRNGLYDYLPEGVFHKTTSIDKADYVARRKEYLEEEKAARLFFLPIENEFFQQRLQIENNERRLLNQFYRLNDDFLREFWGIPKNISDKYALKLMRLIPYAYRIAGDLEMTRLSLQELIKEKVTLKQEMRGQSVPIIEDTDLGDMRLGSDATLGETLLEVNPHLNVIVGPVKNEKLSYYVGNKDVENFLDLFYSYFIPMELTVSTTFTVEESNMELNSEYPPVLGISTQL